MTNSAARTPWLEAPGVILRPLEPSDAEALFVAHSDDQTHLFWLAPAHKDVAQTRAYIEDTLKMGRAWAITESGGEALKQRTLNSPHADGGLQANLKSTVALGTLESKASLDLECDYASDPTRESHSRFDALGRIALFDVREGVGEIGVIVRRGAQGRGLASKALSLVCDYGFNQLGLHRIAADIDPDNNASISLFLRSGFQREGLLRKNWKTHIGLRDSVIMSKVKD
jgi:RimJ/RimL family protein N-acetyltransferase